VTGAVSLPEEQDTLPIVECGDPVLRRAADPVEPSALHTPQLRHLIAQMRTTMELAPGVGLAAPQVGVPLQLAVLQDGPPQWAHLRDDERAVRERAELPFTVLVNPTMQPIGGDDWVSFYEGCLSVPGLTGVVARHRAVRVEALDQDGQPVERVFSGWAARIVQHEVDHLRGRLYLDHVETRSLSTLDNYATRWAARPTDEAAGSLGFALDQPRVMDQHPGTSRRHP
jgi:peptide deformylase